MTDLVMGHDVVQGAGRTIQGVARAFPVVVCLASGGSGSGGVDGALAELEVSVGRLMLGAPAELLSLGEAAVRTVDQMSAVDAALAGAVR